MCHTYSFKLNYQHMSWWKIGTVFLILALCAVRVARHNKHVQQSGGVCDSEAYFHLTSNSWIEVDYHGAMSKVEAVLDKVLAKNAGAISEVIHTEA